MLLLAEKELISARSFPANVRSGKLIIVMLDSRGFSRIPPQHNLRQPASSFSKLTALAQSKALCESLRSSSNLHEICSPLAPWCPYQVLSRDEPRPVETSGWHLGILEPLLSCQTSCAESSAQGLAEAG